MCKFVGQDAIAVTTEPANIHSHHLSQKSLNKTSIPNQTIYVNFNTLKKRLTIWTLQTYNSKLIVVFPVMKLSNIEFASFLSMTRFQDLDHHTNQIFYKKSNCGENVEATVANSGKLLGKQRESNSHDVFYPNYSIAYSDSYLHSKDTGHDQNVLVNTKCNLSISYSRMLSPIMTLVSILRRVLMH